MTGRSALVAKLKGKKPLTTTYDVVLDPEPVAAVVVASAALDRAKRLDKGVEEAAEALRAAEEAAEDAVATLTFQALPRAPYEALQLAHPPTAEQRKTVPPQTYDVETFLPAILAATIVDPDAEAPALTAKQVEECPDDEALPGRLMSRLEVEETIAAWNQGEVGAVWATALSVCEQARNPSLPFGSGRTRG